MKEQFVTYEIALKLKELGFDEDCINFYSFYPNIGWSLSLLGVTNEDVVEQMVCHHNIKGIKAPLWQQVIDWFREKHKIRVCNLVNIYIEATFIIYHSTDVEVIDGNDFYKTREQAILKAIELCKKQ